MGLVEGTRKLIWTATVIKKRRHLSICIGTSCLLSLYGETHTSMKRTLNALISFALCHQIVSNL